MLRIILSDYERDFVVPEYPVCTMPHTRESPYGVVGLYPNQLLQETISCTEHEQSTEGYAHSSLVLDRK